MALTARKNRRVDQSQLALGQGQGVSENRAGVAGVAGQYQCRRAAYTDRSVSSSLEENSISRSASDRHYVSRCPIVCPIQTVACQSQRY